MRAQITALVHRWLAGSEGRFVVAGAAAALINWIARFPLELLVPFAMAVLGAMAIGMASGFLLYDRWVFPSSARPLSLKIRAFIAVNILSQAIMFVTAIGIRELALLAGVPTLFAGAGAHMLGIVAGALCSFFGHRSVTFQR
jgi:energy-coupling factor transport system substrate-specific component